MSEEILAGLDARRDCERDLALVRDQPIHRPLRIARGVSVFVDLEPLKASDVRLRGVVHLGEVRDDRAFVRGVDGVRWIRRVCAIESMVPFGGEGGAGGHSDDVRGNGRVVRVDAAVADEVVGGHIGDGLKEYVSVGFLWAARSRLRLLRRSQERGFR